MLKTNPILFFYTGIAILPAYLFVNNFKAQLIMISGIIILNILTGRKIKIVSNILLTAGIIVANIYPPAGKMYFSIGPFYITHDALFSGLKKAMFLIGTVYISRFSVRAGINFPGSAGKLVYQIFFYFEKLTELHPIKIKKNFINQIDIKLMEIENIEYNDNTNNNYRYNIADLLFFILTVSFYWLIFFTLKFSFWRL
jgi:hypothetical protein